MAKTALVIDDSALMRRTIAEGLRKAGYEIITARNGEEGVAQVKKHQPDVVTLDINMPVMDGLTCLSLITEISDVPVVMVSSLTEQGALATFEALELGAVDYVGKPGGTVSLNMADVEEEIIAKVNAAVAAKKVNRVLPVSASAKPVEPVAAINKSANVDAVLIGVSTGGPGAIEALVRQLPAGFGAPIIIAQHMPERFTGVFAQRLNGVCQLEVIELSHTMALEPGVVHICKGGADAKLSLRSGKLFGSAIPAKSNYTWHPSVTHLINSAEGVIPAKRLVCVQLTGMGDDGAQAMAEMHKRGARTIAESQATAVVFGMPKCLIDLGGASEILPLDQIAQQLTKWVGK
ncbi:chemotaxis protein CheB [Salinibius halmophilus]|uniref:chemotaxis protein CheB n=1 Tax=Salinibius halmophilus TaxID=1853216 RepID=UPI000E668C00|nr:chemotaxis protein CheB [Salinibius halmophilus]